MRKCLLCMSLYPTCWSLSSRIYRLSIVGNHALALAYHGKLLGIPVTCVMPNIAPLTKITSCQELGARVILHGSHILEAREKADEYARDEVR